MSYQFRKLVLSSIKKLLELYAGARSNTLAPVYDTIATPVPVGRYPPNTSRLVSKAERVVV